jgi:hypothetical protein
MAYSRPKPPSRIPPSDSAAYVLWQRGEWSPDPDPSDPPAKLPDQVAVAAEMLRNGAQEVQIRIQLANQFGEHAKPTRAFKAALRLIIQEQRDAQAHLPELLQAIRHTALQGALRSGSWGAAATLLSQLGAVVGEGSQERLLGPAGADLQITIETQAQPPLHS